MLKNPSTIEQELDKLRDQLWQEAGRDADRWFRLIKEKAENEQGTSQVNQTMASEQVKN